MAWRILIPTTVLLLFAACAGDAEETSPTDATTSAGGMGTGGEAVTTTTATGGAPPMLTPQSCPDGTYAVALGEDGMLTCAAFDGDVAAAVDSECEIYFGWRDSCNACTAGPSKYGKVSGHACENIAGADNTCTTPTLGAAAVNLFGLNTDGDVDGNDMFYTSLYCRRTGETPLAGPCEAGEHAVGVEVDGSVACMPTSAIVAEYVRDHCTVYFGWRDSCNGCPDPPSKWGSQRDADCAIGAGADNTCGVPFVDDQWIAHIGINTDGDVDDNDTFFIGLSCDAPAPTTVAGEGGCPFGTLLTGINDDGTLQCTSPTADIAPTVRDACQLFLGYRDSCGACTDDPVKWGATSTTTCDAAVGSTCGNHDLGGVSVNLLGVRSDGDVDGNDKFYAGFSCGSAP